MQKVTLTYSKKQIWSEDDNLIAKLSISQTLVSTELVNYQISGFHVMNPSNWSKGVGTALLVYVLIDCLKNNPKSNVRISYSDTSRNDSDTGQFAYPYNQVFKNGNDFPVESRNSDIKFLNKRLKRSIIKAYSNDLILDFPNNEIGNINRLIKELGALLLKLKKKFF